jgi:hypothetical protein
LLPEKNRVFPANIDGRHESEMQPPDSSRVSIDKNERKSAIDENKCGSLFFGDEFRYSFQGSRWNLVTGDEPGEKIQPRALATSFPRLSPGGKYLFFFKMVAVPGQA